MACRLCGITRSLTLLPACRGHRYRRGCDLPNYAVGLAFLLLQRVPSRAKSGLGPATELYNYNRTYTPLNER